MSICPGGHTLDEAAISKEVEPQKLDQPEVTPKTTCKALFQTGSYQGSSGSDIQGAGHLPTPARHPQGGRGLPRE